MMKIETMDEDALLDLGKYCEWVHDKKVTCKMVRDHVLMKQPKIRLDDTRSKDHGPLSSSRRR